MWHKLLNFQVKMINNLTLQEYPKLFGKPCCRNKFYKITRLPTRSSGSSHTHAPERINISFTIPCVSAETLYICPLSSASDDKTGDWLAWNGVRENLTHENLTIRKSEHWKSGSNKQTSNKFSHVRISHTHKYLACFQPPMKI